MRVANWPLVLAQRIEHWRYIPLRYGETDCCQFVAEVVLALTGVDYRSAFPAYESREQAEQILAQYDGMVGLVTSVLGEPKPVAFAKRGDVIAADFGDGVAAAICVGIKSCAPGPRGLVFLPTLSALAAWSV